MAPIIEPRNYTLGRGRVLFSRYDDTTGLPKEFRYIGNTPEFSLTIEQETLDHFSSDGGIREKDDSVPLEVNRTGTMVCDDIQSENLALFFFGSTAILTTVAAAGQSENFATAQPGIEYQIGITATNPVGIRGVENVTITDDPNTTTYVEGTDYTLDADRGIFAILSSGSIAADQDIIVNYDIRASTQTRILSGSEPVEGAMKFLQANPRGADRDYTFPQVRITPNGDLALKGDEWQQIPFSIEALKPDNQEAIYLDGMPAFT